MPPNNRLRTASSTKMLYPEHVDWEKLHTDPIEAIFDNWATNKTNQYTHSRVHSDQKEKLYRRLARGKGGGAT
jgi:hypothetical protein